MTSATEASLTVAPNGVTELGLNRTLLPGEPVLLLTPGSVVAIAGGLKLAGKHTIGGTKGDVVVTLLCGTVEKTALPDHTVRYSIKSSTVKRYIPRFGDPVVGIVTKVTNAAFMVHICGAFTAYLDALAFDGASKANRPRLRPGDVIYCHVSRAEPDVEPELSCLAVGGNIAKDWTTGESTFGQLFNGTLVYTSLHYVERLMNGTTPILSLLGERIGYEICIGMNGVVWVQVTPQKNQKTSNNNMSTIGLSSATSKAAERAGCVDAALPKTLALAECIKEAQDDYMYEECLQRVNSYFPYV